MRYATAHYLDIVRPYLSDSLISAQVVSRVQAVAELLPPSSNFGFECRLGEPSPDADFSVAVLASDGSRGAWLGENPLVALPSQLGTEPAWQKVRRWFSAWSREYGSVSDAWLEFDLDVNQGMGLPIPSIFVGSDQDGHQKHPQAVVDALRILLERPLPPRMEARLLDCYAALPPGSLLFQVGVMLSRSTDAIRLCINRMRSGEVAGYLERIGWPGTSHEVGELIRQVAPRVDRIGLDFDLGPEGVLPKVGLECALSGKDVGFSRLKAFLGFLVEQRLCLREKAEAIQHWLGCCTNQSDPERWPEYLLKAAQQRGHGTLSTFARTLNHIKLTWSPGGPVVAKAYLGVRHFWVRRSEEAMA